MKLEFLDPFARMTFDAEGGASGAGDTVAGEGGDDTVAGGTGDDTIAPSSGDDTVNPGSSADDLDWRDQFASSVPEEQRKKFRKQLDGFSDPSAAGQKFLEMQKNFDKRVAVPGDDASDEDKDSFAVQMGWVQEADKYGSEYTSPEFATETLGKDVVEAVEAEFLKTMHEARIPQAHATASLDAYYTMLEAQETALEEKGVEMAEASAEALKKQHGDDYEPNLVLAKRYAEQMGAADLLDMDLRNGGKVGDLAPVVSAIMQAARSTIGEDTPAGVNMSDDKRTSLSERLDALYSEHMGKASYKSDAVQREIREINEKLYGTMPADGRVSG
jgi:hypothetical protein